MPVIAQVAEELNENSDLWRLNEVNFYIKILEASMKGQIGASDEEKTALNENINLIMQGYANQFIKILDQFNENNFMLAQQHYLNLKHIAKYSKNNDQLLVRVEGAFQSFFWKMSACF
ncbi:MAG: hypothetical protein HWD59_13900 [Coxiellaceae bacterium]|nr:MAG: hypothetical protein HWD59_13900 [Coxiellaceae bacterium]